MMGIPLWFAVGDSSHEAGGDDKYKATPDSNPWGKGGVPDGNVQAYGQDGGLSGFYVERGSLVGRTETRWNASSGDEYMDTASFASYGDTAPAVNSPSGLGGPDTDGKVWSPGTRFTEPLSQDSLAGNSNPDTPYGH